MDNSKNTEIKNTEIKNTEDSIEDSVIVDPNTCSHTYSNYTSALRYFGGDKQMDYYYCRICDAEIKKRK